MLTCGWQDAFETLTCGESIRFVLGARYVVFAMGEPLGVACDPADLVERAQDVLQWLSAKPLK